MPLGDSFENDAHFSKKKALKQFPLFQSVLHQKNGSILQSGTVFQNDSRMEPFWLHFFLSGCYISALGALFLYGQDRQNKNVHQTVA